MKKEKKLFAGLAIFMSLLLAGCASGPAKYAREYKIGDLGSGGGIVFYDKGNSEQGWRYLEVDFEMKNCWVWGVEGKRINADGTEIGTGKKNSELIANKIPGSYTAADMCRSIKCGNGLKSGWYLPSSEELKLVSAYIKQTNTETKYETYWSSTELNADEAYFMDKSAEIGVSKKGDARGILPIRAF